MNRKTVKVLAVIGLGIGLNSMAFATGPDLTPVTDGMSALSTAVLAAVGSVITLALGLYAIKHGGVWVKKVWSAFAS